MKTANLVLLRSVLFMFLLSSSCLVWAQDAGNSSEKSSSVTSSSTSIHVGGDSAAWYAQPWVWIIGAAVFILLLVALLNGNRKSSAVRTESVTVKKTTATD